MFRVSDLLNCMSYSEFHTKCESSIYILLGKAPSSLNSRVCLAQTKPNQTDHTLVKLISYSFASDYFYSKIESLQYAAMSGSHTRYAIANHRLSFYALNRFVVSSLYPVCCCVVLFCFLSHTFLNFLQKELIKNTHLAFIQIV